MTRSALAHPTADAAACDRYDCGHIARHADRSVRHAGVLFRVVLAHGEAILANVDATPATLAALALMRQGAACSEVSDRYRDPVTNRFVAAAPRRERGTLTAKQVAVLTALADGSTPTEVAANGGLGGITADTVESHRKNIYRILAVHNLGDAVAEAIRQGYPVL